MLIWAQKSGKNQNNHGDVNDHIAEQHPLLKSTTAWVNAPRVTCGDNYFFNSDEIWKNGLFVTKSKSCHQESPWSQEVHRSLLAAMDFNKAIYLYSYRLS